MKASLPSFIEAVKTYFENLLTNNSHTRLSPLKEDEHAPPAGWVLPMILLLFLVYFFILVYVFDFYRTEYLDDSDSDDDLEMGWGDSTSTSDDSSSSSDDEV